MSRAEYGILNPRGAKYQDVLRQFQKSWRHPPSEKSRFKRVVRIIGIRPPRPIQARYNRYKDAVERRGKFSVRGMARGNERRRWHGTPHNHCKLLRRNISRTGYTNDRRCAICSISNTGFRSPGQCHGIQRFGAGIYFSSTSSKSDDYTNRVNGQATPKKGRRAILLCKVVVGRSAKPKAMESQLQRPPRGFDSVIGEVGVFGGLNYDEAVVYSPAAALPAYVIVYE